jgi:hypothetical protein
LNAITTILNIIAATLNVTTNIFTT